MLRRKMMKQLEAWKYEGKALSGLRKAFLLEGARQTGKTFLVRQFAERNYDEFLEVNFYESSDAARLISSCVSAREVVSALSLLVGHEVHAGNTLVFFDEVQEAPEIITQVKFLAEDGRFDVVLSGSLLGVELNNVKSFPVGYVRMERMNPLDFEEFCWAQGVGPNVIDAMRHAYDHCEPLDDALHDRLLRLYRLYLVVGGMPEAVQKYLDSSYDLGAVRDVQSSIVSQYRFDISKYAKGRELQVRAIFDALPAELAKENKRFQLKTLKDKAVFERFADDFAWLVNAGVAQKCNVVSEPAYPLLRTEDRRKFKLYSSDVGLLLAQYPVGVAARVLDGSRDVNFGAVYENAVAQELASYGVPLRYYHNSRKGEVDFLVETEDCEILPVEVKSGKGYKRHAALKNLLAGQNADISCAVVLSEANISTGEHGGRAIRYVPIYLTFCLAESAAQVGGSGREGKNSLSAIDATPPVF